MKAILAVLTLSAFASAAFAEGNKANCQALSNNTLNASKGQRTNDQVAVVFGGSKGAANNAKTSSKGAR